EQGVVRLFGVLVCAAVVLPTLPLLGPVAGALAVLLGAAVAWRLWRWVPDSISGGLGRRPVVSFLWALAAILALLQLGRRGAVTRRSGAALGLGGSGPGGGEPRLHLGVRRGRGPLAPWNGEPLRRALLPRVRRRCGAPSRPGGDPWALAVDRGPLRVSASVP